MTIAILLGAILGTTVILGLAHLITSIFADGLSDIIGTGFNYFTQLFGSGYATLFVSCFGLVGIISFARFIASWFGENAGHNANR